LTPVKGHKIFLGQKPFFWRMIMITDCGVRQHLKNP